MQDAMREVDEVTARGEAAVFGRRSIAELVTRTATRYDSTGTRSQAITTYLIQTDDPLGRWDFVSESDRATFIDNTFAKVRIKPLTQTEQRERPHILAGQVGNDLSEVRFIMDYLVIAFQGPGLNLYVWPRIHRGSCVLGRPDMGYVDSLLALIGTHLIAVDELLDYGLTLDLDDGTRLAVPLDGTDVEDSQVEIAEFHDSDRTWSVWRVGDEPIEWLAPPE
jgi:hypothetical protein